MAFEEDPPSVAADEAPRRHREPDTLAWSRMRWCRDPRTFLVASGGRAAAETLREFGERKFFAADWFTAFSAHAITKRSGESPEQLLARFVVSLNDLQMVGLCSASKRPRGSIEKRTFG